MAVFGNCWSDGDEDDDADDVGEADGWRLIAVGDGDGALDAFGELAGIVAVEDENADDDDDDDDDDRPSNASQVDTKSTKRAVNRLESNADERKRASNAKRVYSDDAAK